ncbi:MAG TPA: hypothetical protein PKN80_03770 [bacterium]|uniref:HAMP domain-containing protein n=1 Tax=candidate division TA06 bacterium ADurb.Bin417 TaxID=1852828 RepID=A0A1V5MJ96_UNCT6|nr:MAG: hypothetical protein BWY73_00388 [candidate division TA06 bacterium ADurb.Bin417]HNQ35164.1 hypothetical protein [bacterium]HNS48625.1 hypothetical protein [bacterium]
MFGFDWNRKDRARHHYLVNKPMQLAYSGFLVWLVGVGMVIAWLITYYTIWNYIINGFPTAANLPAIIKQVNARLFWTLIIPGFLLLGIAGWSQIVLMHRIAGPAYRIRKVMMDMAHGIWPSEVKLRNQDYLKEVADEINLFLNGQRKWAMDLEHQLRELDEVLRESGAGQEEKQLADAQRQLEKVLRDLEAIFSVMNIDSGEKGAGS